MQNHTEFVRDVEDYMINPEDWSDVVVAQLVAICLPLAVKQTRKIA